MCLRDCYDGAGGCVYVNMESAPKLGRFFKMTCLHCSTSYFKVAMEACRFVRRFVTDWGIAYAWGFLSYPCVVTSSAQLIKAEAFCNFQSIWAHLLCRSRTQPPRRTGLWPQRNSRVADLFLVAPLQRTFAQQLPRRCASGLLTSQVRRRRWKRGSSQLDPSEPNSQKANERKARKAKESNARPQSVPTGGGRINFSITRSCNRLWSKSSIRSGFGPSKNAPR